MVEGSPNTFLVDKLLELIIRGIKEAIVKVLAERHCRTREVVLIRMFNQEPVTSPAVTGRELLVEGAFQHD